MTNIDYVIYCRKSSDESSGNQKQSIPDQIKACLQYAKREWLKIKEKPKDFSLFESEQELNKEDKESDLANRKIYLDSRKYYIIKEQETWKIPWKRTKWNRLIKKIANWEIKGLLSYSPDRQARNMLEWWELINLVDEDKVDLKYTNFHFENNASGKMMLGIWFVFSKQYSDKLSEDITRGSKNKVAWWKAIWRYKAWYEIVDGFHKPHKDFFPIIKEAFEMKLNWESDYKIALFINSNWYYREMKKTWERKKIAEKNLYKLWIDPFYYGMFINWDETVDLREYNPNYKPVITEAQHQVLISRYNKTSKKIVKTKKEDIYSDIYQFWNDFIQTYDNAHLTFSLPNKGRYNKKLETELLKWNKIGLKDIVQPHQIIYRCANKNSKDYNLSINLEDVDKEILKALSYLKVSQEDFEEYLEFARERLRGLELDTKDKVWAINLQIWRIKSDKRQYIEKYMWTAKDKDEQEIYENKKKQYDDEINFLRKQLEKEDENERNEILEMELFIDILNNAEQYYKRANYVQKGKIAKILFLNIKIDHQKRLLIQPKANLETLFTLNWWSTIIELRTFFENNKEYSITELYAEKYNDYHEYKWKPIEYYRRKKKNTD